MAQRAHQARRRAGTVQVDAGTSSIDIHRGEALLTFARTYPSLMLTLIEMMQNSIDNEATVVFTVVDLRQRQVVVADNGVGTDRQRFEAALQSVGRTVKDPGKLGRFGRGLVSPIDKCTSYVFSSVPVGQRKGLSWTFRQADIEDQHFSLEIPCKALPALPTLGKRFAQELTGDFNTTYRTHIRMNGITRDKVVSLVDLDELESQVRQKLGPRMQQNGVLVRVVLFDEKGHKQVRDINPIVFTGEPLETVEINDVSAGMVQFELYRAPRLSGKRNGKVTVVENGSDYGITMAEFTRQARGGDWADMLEPAFAALSSGFFEGYIRCKNIELHPERTKFVYNDALLGLYLAIAEWFEHHGRAHYENEQEVTREARYRQLGLQSMERLKSLLEKPSNSRLWDNLRERVLSGLEGREHYGSDGKTPEEESSQRPSAPRGNSGGDTGAGRAPSTRKNPGDMPRGVRGGTGGQKRNVVRGDSQGLWFEYSDMRGNSRLWEFDFERGVLIFNIRHPIWVKLDETRGKHTNRNAKQIMHLQEWLTLELLNLLLHFHSTEELEQHRDFLDQRVKPYVDMFISSSR